MILVNGVQSDSISAGERGLSYGDGVFRTMRVHGGVARHWGRHYAKLEHDCARIGIRCPAETTLSRELHLACEAGGDYTAKIIVTRGVAARGYAYADELEPTRIVLCSAHVPYPSEHAKTGVRARKCNLVLSSQPPLAGIKHLNRLENVLARAEWQDSGIAEGLLCDERGDVIGGTMTNVFIAAAGALSTPVLTRCGVAGVTRERVIDAARAHGVRCVVRTIQWQELMESDEVILVNSLAGAWPVREIDGHVRVPGPLSRSIQDWLELSDA